jgi:hypothetical protein
MGLGKSIRTKVNAERAAWKISKEYLKAVQRGDNATARSIEKYDRKTSRRK